MKIILIFYRKLPLHSVTMYIIYVLLLIYLVVINCCHTTWKFALTVKSTHLNLGFLKFK